MREVLSTAFMPVVDDVTGQVVYFEALARAKSSRSGAGHQKLIELGEDFGFVHMIDTEILRKAAEALRYQGNLVIGVNVSALTLQHSLGEMLSVVFRNLDVVDRLVFEITETVRIEDLVPVRLFFQAIRLLRGRVAFDDFGAGHFTTELIEELKPDFVKLSGEIVNALSQHEASLRDLVTIVSRYGGALIAEHVDSEEKRQRLRDRGVAFMQGFLFGKPDMGEHINATVQLPLRCLPRAFVSDAVPIEHAAIPAAVASHAECNWVPT